MEGLEADSRPIRLKHISELGERIRSGSVSRIVSGEVNNHVHTYYSFSPYSPSGAAFRAWDAGLLTVGVMDHDSVAGCLEMLDAGRAIGMPTTVGFEMRVRMEGTLVEDRRLNSPDSLGIAYIAIHGIPKSKIDEADAFLKPIRKARNERNRKMTSDLSTLIVNWGLDPIDFDTDVYPISWASEGGSITERHLLFALAKRLVSSLNRGVVLADFLHNKLGIEIPDKILEYLSDPENPHYLFDLLGLLKTAVLPPVFVQPNSKECISVDEALDFARGVGAIPAYAYLGDVTESPTGDKKAEEFEDSYLDLLMNELQRLGFAAITYMPPRNTLDQLRRVQGLCADHGFMEISGVDINSSRQSFNCPELLQPEFSHLADAAWALIAHEKLANIDPLLGFFHPGNPHASLPFNERLRRYSEIGKMVDHHNPESAISLLGAY